VWNNPTSKASPNSSHAKLVSLNPLPNALRIQFFGWCHLWPISRRVDHELWAKPQIMSCIAVWISEETAI
jgi:hypothetical protein